MSSLFTHTGTHPQAATVAQEEGAIVHLSVSTAEEGVTGRLTHVTEETGGAGGRLPRELSEEQQEEEWGQQRAMVKRKEGSRGPRERKRGAQQRAKREATATRAQQE